MIYCHYENQKGSIKKMTEYIKKSDIINLIKEYEQMGKKIYKDKPNIKSLDIAKLKKDILNLKTYKSKD